jgi:DNA-binding winged helix-turn-helix (wHTH) protein
MSRLVQMDLTLNRVDGMVPRMNEVVNCLLKIEKTMDVMEKVAFQPTGQPAYAPRRPAPAAGATVSELETLKREFANPRGRSGKVATPEKKPEASTPDRPPTADAADLVIDDTAGRVYLGAKKIDLTTLEYCLLRCFGQQAGQSMSWEALAEKIRLYVAEEDRGRVHDLLAALIERLRKKLGDDPDNPTYLSTMPGGGWVLQHATYIPPLRR